MKTKNCLYKILHCRNVNNITSHDELNNILQWYKNINQGFYTLFCASLLNVQAYV